MEKMINPDGVKANMCCAHNILIVWYNTIKRRCIKKNKFIINGRYKCGYYRMAEFFQKRGYKPLKN